MRLIIRIGLQPEVPTPPVDLRASGEDSAGRWLTANLSLKNVLGVLTFAAYLIAQHVTTSSRMTAIETRQEEQSRAYERDKGEINADLRMIERAQIQILSSRSSR